MRGFLPAMLGAVLTAATAAVGQQPAPLVIQADSGWVAAVAFSPDGQWLATGGSDQQVKFWNAATGAKLQPIALDSPIAAIAYDPAGQRLAAGTWAGTIHLIDPRAGRLALTIRAHADNITSLAFSPDGKQLVSGGGDDRWKTWDTATGQNLHSGSQDNEYDVTSVAFSPRGNQIASGDGENNLTIWHAATAKAILVIDGHEEPVSACAFLPGGQRVVSGSWDDTLKIWDAASGRELHTLRGHDDDVKALAVISDGKRLASAGEDQTVRLWDAASGQELAVFRDLPAAATCVAFSPDGRRLVAGSRQIIKIWSLR